MLGVYLFMVNGVLLLYTTKLLSLYTTNLHEWQVTVTQVFLWIKLCIVKAYISIIFFVFVQKYITCRMSMYYFRCSEKFCVKKSIRICQALNFMEPKLLGPFLPMSSFKIGLLLLIRSLAGKKWKLFPIVQDWYLASAERLFLI